MCVPNETGGLPQDVCVRQSVASCLLPAGEGKRGRLSQGQFWALGTIQNHQSLNFARPGERSSSRPAIPTSKPFSAEAGTLSLVLDSSAEPSEKHAASFSLNVGRRGESTLSPRLEAPCAWLQSCLNSTSGPASLHGRIVVVGRGCVFSQSENRAGNPFLGTPPTAPQVQLRPNER